MHDFPWVLSATTLINDLDAASYIRHTLAPGHYIKSCLCESDLTVGINWAACGIFPDNLAATSAADEPGIN